MKMKVLLASLAAMLIFIVALTKQPVNNPTLKSVGGELPIVGSTEKFAEIITELNNKQNYLNRAMPVMEMSKEESAVPDSGGSGDTS
ncbi:hypothetical protein KHA80_22145 [Anaerobacillus sp. HL2]|nr:hypothetical protein KHA80_22145 [Anaerobacillus sp. HL2]